VVEEMEFFMNCKICNSLLDEESLRCPVCNFDNSKELVDTGSLVTVESESRLVNIPEKHFESAE